MRRAVGWPLVVLAIALGCLVLRFYQESRAAPPSGNQPFANAVQQRMEMIDQLKEIRVLLKEQNGLLKQQNRVLRAAFPAPAAETTK